MKKSAKILCAVLALVLALGCGVGGTMAFLAVHTEEVANTFTFGDLSIKLEETTPRQYQIVPGRNLNKNPKATVTTVKGADQVPAWLFVKVEEKNWPTAKVGYAIEGSWKTLKEEPTGTKIIYREITVQDYDKPFQILAGDKTFADGVVTVDGSMTKSEVEAAMAKGNPSLTFTAYAIQKEGFPTAEAAWKEVSVTSELVTK